MTNVTHRALLAAGGAAVRFNAPMSEGRARRVVDWIGELDAGTVVDFGCGLAQHFLPEL